MTIAEILTKHGSDKDSCHGYGSVYEQIFKNLPDDLTMLEIGVDAGASLKAWREYRPKSDIWAIDINPIGCGEKLVCVDIKTHPKFPVSFDLIIDDGSHKLSDISFVIENYIKNLKPHGVMVIEDIRHPEWFEALVKVMTDSIWPLPHKSMEMIETNYHYDDRIIIIK